MADPLHGPFLLHCHHPRSPQPLQLSVLLPEQGQWLPHTRAPSLLLLNTAVPRGSGGTEGSLLLCPGHPGRQHLLPALSDTLWPLVRGSVAVSAPTWRWGPPSALPATALSPQHQQDLPRGFCGTQISASELLPPDWLTGSSIPGPQPGCGTPKGHTWQCQAPGLPVRLP